MKNINDRKELIKFNFDKKRELETLKQGFFKDKQNIQAENTKMLWALKNAFQDKVHKNQLEKMKLAIDLKLKSLNK